MNKMRLRVWYVHIVYSIDIVFQSKWFMSRLREDIYSYLHVCNVHLLYLDVTSLVVNPLQLTTHFCSVVLCDKDNQPL